MQCHALALAALLSVAPFSAATQAFGQSSGPVMISDAWSRPAVQGGTAVGYFTVMNHGRGTETLVSVESPLSRKVEIHRTAMDQGVSSMSAVPKLQIPYAGMVIFAPGGYHLMFFGISRTLKAGEKLPATLTFADGRQIKVDFAVRTGFAGPSEHAAHPGG